MTDASLQATATDAQTPSDLPPTSEVRSLRVWPLALILAVLAAAKIIPAVMTEVSPSVFMLLFIGPMVCALATVIWMLVFSRARAQERLTVTAIAFAIVAVTYSIAHPSMQGMYFIVYVIPIALGLFCLVYLVAGRSHSKSRQIAALIVLALGFGGADLLRNNGMWGNFRTDFMPRWTPSAEDKFLAKLDRQKEAVEGPSSSLTELPSIDWPAFRGINRDGVLTNVQLDNYWDRKPPTLIWERDVGPGWGSFSAAGDLLFTQEQRGEKEAVVCYSASTGEVIWSQEAADRFYEAVAGAGPRATPTLQDGALYALGANGWLRRLNPLNGKVVWEVDIKEAGKCQPPMWGFSSSPLIAGDLVVVHAGGANTGEDRSKTREVGTLLAYSIDNGEFKWSTPTGAHSYCSPQLSKLDGIEVVLITTNEGLTAVDPVSGKLIGSYDWQYQGYRVLQPLVLGERDVLIGTGMGSGTQRVTAKQTDDGLLTFEMVWESKEMKPDFNDWVAFQDHLYGFDHDIFACVDLETGKRVWKKGRFGNGQVLLLADGGQLLVLSEKGELILIDASPEGLEERGRFAAIQGKTWNHPIMVGNRVYVRNGERAACVEVQAVEPRTGG